MRTIKTLTLTFLFAFGAVVAACQESTEHSHREGRGEHADGRGHDDGSGEHGPERGRAGEGEESGERLRVADTWDRVRGNGARLILSYDKASESFRGTVENTLQRNLCRVRVEVHLSNNVELGPTAPTNLKPGQKMNIALPAKGNTFDWWSTHPETSACGSESGGEHGHGGESGHQ